jgi:hypothetical protein
MVGGRSPVKGPVEGGTVGGTDTQVEPTTTRVVVTAGTVESRTRLVKPPPKQPQRRSTRAVPASGTAASVIPVSRNYSDNLQKQPAEENERQSLGQASTSSDVFPKVTVKQQLAGMTRPLVTISEVTVKENTKEESDNTIQTPRVSPPHVLSSILRPYTLVP